MADEEDVFFITHSVGGAVFSPPPKLIVMTPSPGRIAHRFQPPFSKQFIDCQDSRAVKSSPAFVDMREEVLALIHASPGLTSDPRGARPNRPRGEGLQPARQRAAVWSSAWSRWCPAGVLVARYPSRLDQGSVLPTPEKIFGAFVSAMKATFRAARRCRSTSCGA